MDSVYCGCYFLRLVERHSKLLIQLYLKNQSLTQLRQDNIRSIHSDARGPHKVITLYFVAPTTRVFRVTFQTVRIPARQTTCWERVES